MRYRIKSFAEIKRKYSDIVIIKLKLTLIELRLIDIFNVTWRVYEQRQKQSEIIQKEIEKPFASENRK